MQNKKILMKDVFKLKIIRFSFFSVFYPTVNLYNGPDDKDNIKNICFNKIKSFDSFYVKLLGGFDISKSQIIFIKQANFLYLLNPKYQLYLITKFKQKLKNKNHPGTPTKRLK
ncbi:hypothetical protein BpHYR1_044026 [Brachionus plicatilis]|uniref:Uncharacterized protein n=1 Tax=Brachionus plicatilis TaxID=10195 RepID=A0A3M7SIG7_BRAPC|nr:hypothetical protein BpHYR1_044026 [Brachionus plicatilis]